jgi:hypothetical protein
MVVTMRINPAAATTVPDRRESESCHLHILCIVATVGGSVENGTDFESPEIVVRVKLCKCSMIDGHRVRDLLYTCQT